MDLSVNHMLCWWCWRSGLGFHIHGSHHTFALAQALIIQQGMGWWSVWYIFKVWFSLNHKCIFIEAKMMKLFVKNLKVTTNMHAFAYTQQLKSYTESFLLHTIFKTRAPFLYWGYESDILTSRRFVLMYY